MAYCTLQEKVHFIQLVSCSLLKTKVLDKYLSSPCTERDHLAEPHGEATTHVRTASLNEDAGAK